ncbi:MAG: hypothetical protein A2020_11705 [Lentisphaerae bacterium GWF2_45_14]|nr:MAG: hypothetical protein A2020_11705 [Lentisphaerae bacterium GWF2_45_14]
MKKNNSTEKLEKAAEMAEDSFRVLFQEPVNGVSRIRQINNANFLELLRDALSSIKSTLQGNEENTVRPSDFINALAEKTKSPEEFNETLESCILEILVAKELFLEERQTDQLVFYVSHAVRLLDICSHLFTDFCSASIKQSKSANGLSQISPSASRLKSVPPPFRIEDGQLPPLMLEKLRTRAFELDPFRIGRAFRFIDGVFIPVALASIRAASKFYGYTEARHKFHEYFDSFLREKSNLPLLISSLPGLGKTHFTIAHALSCENLSLILPEPESLEQPLENLISRLAARKNRKFVIFFDDINVSEVDWYYFRTNVGGSFALPTNVSIVIAANQRFPANITSRGRSFEFPIFDEIRCMEMVHDFLISLGMRNPPPDLVSVISADYVECFGQKAFDELSPRTLVHYLEKYEKDPALRKRMLDLSREEVISRPDSQIFLEANVKILKAIYGEEAIAELRKQQLGE